MKRLEMLAMFADVVVSPGQLFASDIAASKSLEKKAYWIKVKNLITALILR